MRRVAPIAIGEIRSRSARTGAPARASTVLTPTVRSSVLLPDMFEPLTTSTRSGPPRLRSFAHAAPGRDQRVPDPLGVEEGAVRLDLGEGVARVLVGVGRQGAEGLEVAHRGQPVGDGAAGRGAPGLDGECQLGGPEQEGPDRGEELVLHRVEEVDQPRQPRDPMRGRLPPDARASRSPRSRGASNGSRSSRASSSASSRRSLALRSTAARTRRTRSLSHRANAPGDDHAQEERARPRLEEGPSEEPRHGEGREQGRRPWGSHGPRGRGGTRPTRRAHPDRCPARTSAPRIARSSRRSIRGRSSAIAAWRAPISSRGAGASSQAASVSSPAFVRAVQRRSKSEPTPKRSRSAA